LPAQALAASDTTPPVIDVEILPSQGTGVWDGWYRAPMAFRIKATDVAGVARVFYRLTGAQTGEAETESSQIEGTISAEGVTLITMKATDPFGNVATRTYGVGIDLTDPTAEIIGLGLVLEGEEHRVTFTCADPAGAIVACTAKNDGRPFTSGDLIDTSFGIRQLAVTAVDRVGRTKTTPYAYSPLRVQTITKRPAVSGSPRVGGTLRITSGAATPTTATSYHVSRWYIGDRRIAEGVDLRLTPEHLDQSVRCEQTFINQGHLQVTGSVYVRRRRQQRQDPPRRVAPPPASRSRRQGPSRPDAACGGPSPQRARDHAPLPVAAQRPTHQVRHQRDLQDPQDRPRQADLRPGRLHRARPAAGHLSLAHQASAPLTPPPSTVRSPLPQSWGGGRLSAFTDGHARKGYGQSSR